MKDMFNILGKVKEMEAKLREAQEHLVNITAEGEGGGGMVKAVVNGKRQVIRLEIDKDIITPDDKEMIQDLVIAAINKALNEVEEKNKEYLQKNAEGMFPNMPDLGNFLK